MNGQEQTPVRMVSDDEQESELNQQVALGGTDAVLPAQVDEEDEAGTRDFSLLGNAAKKNVRSQSLRKGEKDFESHGTQAQANALEESRKVMEDVLGYTRMHRQSQNWVRAWYLPDHLRDSIEREAEVAVEDEEEEGTTPLGAEEQAARQREVHALDRVVVLEESRGPLAQNMGRSVPGLAQEDPTRWKTWLLPEEALFLLERGTIDVWWPLARLEKIFPSPTQVKESRTHSGVRDEGTQDEGDEFDLGVPLSLEAAYSLLIGDNGSRGKITLQQYQVYANLRRMGYVVFRAPAAQTRQDVARQSPAPTSLWRWLISLVQLPEKPIAHPPYGPLVTPGLHRSYKAIYRRLELITRHEPSSTAAARPPKPAEGPFQICFHVWKSGHEAFAKSNPPPPDFYLAVVDAQDSFVPTLDEVSALLASTPWSPPTAPPHALYPRLKHGHRNVLVAIVDHGIVNYMRFAEAAFGQENLVSRFDHVGGPRGKGGRGRGSGRGGRGGRRGRGGGRGRA
jgi:tRNA-splicing endonuclease subunit Sen54